MTRYLTFANVTATIALLLAASGTAVAAQDHLNGSAIKKHSIPGNRIKKEGLTGKQVKEETLGTVPSATYAGHSGVADSLVGGLGPASFAPAAGAQFGVAPETAVDQVLLSLPGLHVTVETGSTGTFDQKVTVRNNGTAPVTLVGAFGSGNIAAAHTGDIGASSYPGDGSNDTTILLESQDHHEALLHCWFPGAGIGTVDIWCFATGSG